MFRGCVDNSLGLCEQVLGVVWTSLWGLCGQVLGLCVTGAVWRWGGCGFASQGRELLRVCHAALTPASGAYQANPLGVGHCMGKVIFLVFNMTTPGGLSCFQPNPTCPFALFPSGSLFFPTIQPCIYFKSDIPRLFPC